MNEPKPGGLVIGYTCRRLPTVQPAFTLLGPARGPLRPAILLRDGLPASGPDQLEVLVHELGHYLGAVRIPDPNSVMRPTVGDGKAELVFQTIYEFDGATLKWHMVKDGARPSNFDTRKSKGVVIVFEKKKE